MCGIAGIFTPGRPVDANALAVMLRCLRHRGPDDEGVHFADGVAMGARRLSIIDVAGGRQPLDVGEGVVVSQNGEIYNFPGLREELSRAGESFRTHSDTEVIGKLYRAHGEACFERLSGMFAVAIHDPRSGRLVLARDRSGIKPLYVADIPGGIAYASELTALRAAGFVDGRPSEEALRSYAYFGFVSGRQSALRGAVRVGPGEVHVIEAGGRRAYRFARPYSPRERGSLRDPGSDLLAHLGAAVERHTLSDVPVGVFLSGGLDSGALVALLARSGRHYKTFSIGAACGGHMDERAAARAVAERYGCEHFSASLPDPTEELVRELARAFDEPFADSSAYAQLALSRLARQHVTVALSGTGGDETLSGYERYALPGLLRAARTVPAGVARAMARGIRSRAPDRHTAAGERWLRLEKLLAAREQREPRAAYAGAVRIAPRLWAPLAHLGECEAGEYASLLLHQAGLEDREFDLAFGPAFDHRVYLPDDLLVKEDRASMAVSLESRVPFLDVEWLRWSELAGEAPKRAGGPKGLFRRALMGLLPAGILERPKHGFAMPVADWLRSDNLRWAGEVLRHAGGASGLDGAAAHRLFEQHRRREVDAGEELWAALMLELWRQESSAAARAEPVREPVAASIDAPRRPLREPPVKVVRIISRMNVGGPAIHVSLLAAGLREHGFDTLLVKGVESPGEGTMDDIVAKYGVNPVVVPGLRREMHPWHDARALAGLIALLRRERPAIVHTHTSKAGILGRIAARAAGVPIVVHTFHGHLLEGYFHPLLVRGIVHVERQLARHTTRLIAVSRATADDMVRVGVAGREKLIHIPLGLPIDPLFDVVHGRGVFRASLGVPRGVPLVGIVARLADVKRHELFLQAAALVLAEEPSAHFAVVGGGEREALLRRLAGRLGISGRVHFAGFRRDLEDVFSDLDVKVLCSRNEGLPVAVIEAMAAGVPVVATEVGGVRQLLGDDEAGLLVRPEDAPGIARAVVHILRHPALAANFVAAGRLRAEAYREQRLVQAMAALYHELLSESRP